MTGNRGAPSLGGRHLVARLISQSSVPITIALVTLLTTFLAGAAPRLLDEVAVDDLRATVTDPLPAQRNIAVERAGRPVPGTEDDPFGSVETQGEQFAASAFPSSVSAIVSSMTWVVESPRFAIEPLPGESAPHPFDMFVKYRNQDLIDENSELVSGRLPEPQDPIPVLAGDECPSTAAEVTELMRRLQDGQTPEGSLDCAIEEVPLFETAVTAETLEALGLELDQVMLLRPDRNDILYFGVGGDDIDYMLAMRVSGVVELTDPGLEYWYGDPSLHRPSIEETADFRIIYATGLLSPSDYPDFSAVTTPASWANTWRHFVDPESVANSDVDILQSDLRSLQNEFSVIASRPGDFRVLTQLEGLLSAHESQKSQTLAMLSISIAGLFAVSLSSLLLLGVLMTDRQRAGVILTRNRGGSVGQLTLSRFYEAAVLVGVPAVFGYLAGKTLLGHDDLLSYRLVVAMAGAATLMLIVPGLIFYRRRLGSLQSVRSDVPRNSARRALCEIALLVVTIASVAILRRRGTTDTETQEISFDFLLAVTPFLIAASVGVLLLRLFPFLVTAASWLTGRARGAIWFVAMKRIAGGTPGANLPMVVIVVCVAAASLAAITSHSINTGQEASSWQRVGADYSVEGFRPGVALPVSLDISALAVEGSAEARTHGGVRIDMDTRSSTATVVAIESTAYVDLVADSPLDVTLPDEMTDGVLADGTAENPMPAIVSSQWAARNQASVGDLATADLGATEPVVQIRSIETTFPDVEPGTDFVIIDLPELRGVAGVDLPATVAYLRAPASSAPAITESVAADAPGALITSRYEWLNEIESDPFVDWATRALDLVFWLAIVFAVAVAVAGLVLTAASRRRDLAHLRTMGLQPSQSAWLVFVEQLPGVALGTLGGIAAGVIAAVALAPMIVLDAFTGDLLPTPMSVSWFEILVTGFVVVVAMTVAVGIFVLVSRRDDVGQTLRMGEES